MNLFKNRQTNLRANEVDTDIIAFNVTEEDMDEIVDYMIASLMAKSLAEFGETPDILQ